MLSNSLDQKTTSFPKIGILEKCVKLERLNNFGKTKAIFSSPLLLLIRFLRHGFMKSDGHKNLIFHWKSQTLLFTGLYLGRINNKPIVFVPLHVLIDMLFLLGVYLFRNYYVLVDLVSQKRIINSVKFLQAFSVLFFSRVVLASLSAKSSAFGPRKDQR